LTNDEIKKFKSTYKDKYLKTIVTNESPLNEDEGPCSNPSRRIKYFKMNIIKKKLNLILITSCVIKVITVFFLYEKNLSDEWFVLFNNFEKLNLYSYYTLKGLNIPSSYMPPMYFIFIYFNKLLSFNLFNFIYLIYFFQILLSTISVTIFYKLCRSFFDEKISVVGALIFAFFPLLVFSTSLISSATIQVFLYLLFFNYSINIIENKIKINIFLFSIISASCLLLRGEFLIVFLLSLIFFMLTNKKKIKFALITLFITFLIISPYIIRNYAYSNKILLVNVSGYALWKGNNHLAKVEGYNETLHPDFRDKWPDEKKFFNLYKKLNDLKIDLIYESKRDKIFFEEAIINILQDKKKYFILYLKKFLSYFFIDINSSINNYYNPFHIVPVIVVAFMSLPGIIISITQKGNKKKYYVLTMMFSLLFLISTFYILPRYKISIIMFQILFSLFTFDYIFKKRLK